MKYRKVSRGRKMSSWKGNSKFKTRHRKMRGGVGGVGSVQDYDCIDDDSNVGGPYADYRHYHMHAAESEINPKSKFIKEHNGPVNTLYADNTMRMGMVNIRSGLKGLFAPQIKHLRHIGLTQVLFTNPTNCRNHIACKSPFYTYNHKVIHVNTRYVFFGKLNDKGVKNGWGLCYDVSDPNRGRIFIGYWTNGLMNGLGIEVDFVYDVSTGGSTPVGVYYGNFLEGRRRGYGKYHKCDKDKATLFQTTKNDRCLLLHKSFVNITPDHEQERLKKSFSTQCKASFFMSTDPSRVLNIKEYMEIFLRDVESSISDTLNTIESNDEQAAFNQYLVIYRAFVSDCEDILNKALDAYKQTKHKDKFAAEQQAAEKEALRTQAALLKARGIITGEIVDPEEEEAKKERIATCETLLKGEGYVIQTPHDKKEKEKADEKAKLDAHDALLKAKEELDELNKELALLRAISSGKHESTQRRNRRFPTSRHTTHSYSPNSPTQATESSQIVRALIGRSGSRMSSDGGGSLTRKNRRTGKRGMRRKSRRHRGHHRHHHH